MPQPEVVVLIPESTRKRKGGIADAGADRFPDVLPAEARGRLRALREEVLAKSPAGSVDAGGLMPAYRRYDGNMYRYISDDAWEGRSPKVEVIIASGLGGLIASRDPVPAYIHSMAESMPPFGKLNRWWHDHGLPDILAAYIRAVRPKTVVDLLSLEYRESVTGYATGLRDVDVKPIDFPGMGRASQPRRGETVAEILRTAKV